MTQKPNNHSAQPLKEAIDDWFKNSNGVAAEDFWVSYKGAVPSPEYDVVDKPKHYMLFKYDELYKYEEGVEVRDVIEKLVWKVKMDTDKNVPDWEMAPMFDADYTQMMQYLMRFMDKNGVEDLKKARWYLNELIDSYEHHV